MRFPLARCEEVLPYQLSCEKAQKPIDFYKVLHIEGNGWASWGRAAVIVIY